ncbi:hypothetical protein M9458_002250, partial [Cirrhinus mrigala]
SSLSTFVPGIRAGKLSRGFENPAGITCPRCPPATLQAISSQEDDHNLTYARRSGQLVVCYGGQQKGKAVSKRRISHWLVDTIRTAYQARGYLAHF